MAEIQMVARSVGVGPNRTVVQLRAIEDRLDATAPGGHANIIISDPDEMGDFEEGGVYTVTVTKAKGADASPQALAQQAAAAAAAIPNSTNTARFVTPPEQKVPPPAVPDGVVTEPRPTVIMEPVSGTPSPTAGVVSPPSTNPAVASTVTTPGSSGGGAAKR